jgi:hypothetical protein
MKSERAVRAGTVGLALCAVLLTGCLKSREMRAVEAAADAMGGKDKIQSLRTVEIQGEGENGNLGQNFTPATPLTTWKVTNFRQIFDFDNKRMRISQIRTAQFAFAGENPLTQVVSLDHDVAWNKTGDQESSRLSDQATRDRQADSLHNPVAALKAALEKGAVVSRFRNEGNQDLVDVATASGHTFTLGLDRGTHLPASVMTVTDQPNLGDVEIATAFSDYADVNGLKLPMRITSKIDQWPRSDLRVSRYVLNPDASDLAASNAMKAEAPATAVPLEEVTTEEAGKGIWLLGGAGNHHSVVFEFGDHLTLFELPESEARAKAVIDRAHSLKFGKPLTEVIISHHHFDHSAGLRLAVEQGLTIITQRGNIPFFKDLIARKHTLVPDQLAKSLSTQRTQFKPVDDELVLKDDTMELDLYHVKDNSHCDTLLMGWVPRDSSLVQADLYDSGWVTQPWADNLQKNVDLRKLKPLKDIPVHGKAEPWTDVLATLKAKSKS